MRLRHTALAIALGMSLTGVAMAQSRSAGTIFGNAEAGAQVTIKSKDTGLTRTVTADASGRYAVSELPLGTYVVNTSQGTRDNVQVGVGGTEVDFAATELGQVTVSANSLPAIDVSSVDTSVNLSSTVLNQVPIARDVTQAAVLAPTVIKGDSRYGNVGVVRRFGCFRERLLHQWLPGHQLADQHRPTTLPFDAIASEQVITGGYSARYGRSTGGVINIVTKSGTNEWKFGGLVTWTPDSLRASRKDIYRPPTRALPPPASFTATTAATATTTLPTACTPAVR